uniref:Proteasome alpha-type subunits domain-containing protein n=1 Tax=Paramoeba aestuarina TaxID=180227 RepID=A0A7S4KUQ1_9EUKA|mmetsp:Transcript_25787/g.40243  ORF Transcript_25787/g.40243 Transcript_25787/m.40243 type:complete len:237 (+) Transcript_25787:31-741(+)
MPDASYSFSLTTFNPSGKLLQIEHALSAVENGGLSLAIRTPSGIVLATEKKLPSSLMKASEIHKVYSLDEHIGCVYSGIGPDARILVATSRKICQKYKLSFGAAIPTRTLVKEIANIVQEFTQSGGVRPFGVSLLIAGWDHVGPSVYQVDPGGSFFSWKASAIGHGSTSARRYLDKRYSDDLEREDAIFVAISTLKEMFNGRMTEENVEIGVVYPNGTFRLLSNGNIHDYLEANSS